MYYPGESLTGYVLLKTIENFKLKGEPFVCLHFYQLTQTEATDPLSLCVENKTVLVKRRFC